MKENTKRIKVKYIDYEGLNNEFDKTVELPVSDFKQILDKQEIRDYAKEIINNANTKTTVFKKINDILIVDLVQLYYTLNDINNIIHNYNRISIMDIFYENDKASPFFDIAFPIFFDKQLLEKGLPVFNGKSGYSDSELIDIPYHYEIDEDDNDYEEQEEEALLKWENAYYTITENFENFYDLLKQISHLICDVCDMVE